jgi:hypothetical protein
MLSMTENLKFMYHLQYFHKPFTSIFETYKLVWEYKMSLCRFVKGQCYTLKVCRFHILTNILVVSRYTHSCLDCNFVMYGRIFERKPSIYISTSSTGHFWSKAYVPSSNVKVTHIIWRYSLSHVGFEGTLSCQDCNFVMHWRIFWITSRWHVESKAHVPTSKVKTVSMSWVTLHFTRTILSIK